MEQLFLMPGEERYERFKDGNGVPKVHYSYRSMRGAFFRLREPQLRGSPASVRKLACGAGSLLPQLT